uniref:efflux transporter outer membrane subunit n=1 Tax=Sphingomonas populi TaxID=2484750 RepID=UPI0013EE4314|nr:efflux transporter outer membrane subunit [Sphingomonas populi]
MLKHTPLVALALLGACTVGPNYAGPPKAASDAVARGGFVRAKDATFVPAPALARWWEALGDATLNGLVDDALAHSPNIDLAQARIREAQAQLTSKRANELPSISANATYLHAGLPGTNLGGSSSDSGSSSSDISSLNFYNLGGQASWEVDLFGGGRRGIEQARAGVAQRFADLADAQVSLSAQVAQAYVNLRDVQERQRLNAESSKLQRQALDLTRQRLQAGTASQLDVQRLQTQVQNTDAQNVPLAAQIDQYKDQLAVLTGRTPGALDPQLDALAPVPLPPAQVPVGDPATLIAHRPDIRSAERALAAGNAAIGVQTAKLYPKINFMGILGLGGTSPGDVFDPGKLTTLIAPMLSWSFLDFGRTRAAIHTAEAQRDQAGAQYRETVLEALQDAEKNLSLFGNVRQQLGQLRGAEVTAAQSARLNAQRYQAGTSTLIDQLDIERQRLSAAIAVAQAKAQLTNAYIGVQKSLGLGWSDPAKDAPVRSGG